MKRLVTWGILVVALMASMSYASAQADGPIPEPLPFGPETSTFFIVGTLDVETSSCASAIQSAHGGGTEERPYATNNPKDPCARNDEPRDNKRSAYRSSAPSFGAISIGVMPVFQKEVPMNAEESMTAAFTLLFTPINDASSGVDFGGIKPKVSLMSGETSVASWDGGGEVVDNMEVGTTDIVVSYEIDFGKAPESLPKGALSLVIDMTNDPANQDIRAIAQRVTLLVSEGSRGSVVLPFSPEAAGSGPGNGGSDDGNGTGNETGNETDGNETGNQTGNETGNQTTPEPTNTTAGNNTTAPPATDESGFLPGFEVVAVVSAALIALAYVSRERRRPPIRVVR